MVVAIPPLMVLIPAMLALGVEIAAAVVGFVAALTVVSDGVVEIGFGFLDCVLAFRSVIGVRYWNGCEPGKRGQHNCCKCGVSNSSNQGFSPLDCGRDLPCFSPQLFPDSKSLHARDASGACCMKGGDGFAVTKVHGEACSDSRLRIGVIL
jgi:hypothetical protein